MKHIMGNTPKCYECRWYREKEDGEQNKRDGWCTCKKALRTNAIGQKRENPPEREPVMQNDECSWWEDAEFPYINHFEAMTRKPDPNRKPVEQMIITDAIQKAVEEQKDLDAYYERKRQEARND